MGCGRVHHRRPVLPLPPPSLFEPFASAHTVGHAEAKASQPEIAVSGKASRNENANSRFRDSSGAPAEPPHPRGRHRVSAPAPPALEHALPTRSPVAGHEPAVSDASRSRLSGQPAALQAFRR
ncbi:hypothetical protein SUDANB106_05660 [Streptomyces sp. enrichment culture]